MHVSEARVIANQANAARSTGPKTAEGKAKSRQNSLKHGLSGEGVVISAEESNEVELRAEELRSDLKPRSPIGRILVRQMALLSVRMERGERHETASLSHRVRHAVEAFDEARIDEVEQLFGGLAANPRESLRKLRKSPEGIDKLIVTWRNLREDLLREPKPLWDDSHDEMVLKLCGVSTAEARSSSVAEISKMIRGHFDGLTPLDGVTLDLPSRQLWAKKLMLEQIDAEISELEAHRETLDLEMIELDRLEAPDRALFDPSKEATLARRYEAEASRRFFKALKEFKQAEADAAERAEAVQEAEPVASFREGIRATPRDPQPIDPPPLPGSDVHYRNDKTDHSNLDRRVL